MYHLVLLGFLVLVPMAVASPAWAVSTHLYDPALSLTGSCEVSSEDDVADPGLCPGVPDVDHPLLGLEMDCGAATDREGDIYVASPANASNKGRIDVFAPDGRYLTEIKDEFEPCSIAVDSQGNVYARQGAVSKLGAVAVYKPSAYPPQKGTTYGETEVYDPAKMGNPGADTCLYVRSLAVDPSNDHLFLAHICRIEVRGSAVEGIPLINESLIPAPSGYGFKGVDVYGANHDVYVSAEPVSKSAIGYRVFLFDGIDNHVKCNVSSTEAAGKEVSFHFGLFAGLAVDQSSGDFYVWDLGSASVFQIAVEGEKCSAAGQLSSPPKLKEIDGFNDVAVDAPIEDEEPGYNSPNAGTIYVTSGGYGEGHLYAFKLKKEEAPRVRDQQATEITETEAILRARVHPGGLATTYHFEYTTKADFDAHGYANATKVPTPAGEMAGGGAFVAVSAPIEGLEPGTAYRFRLVAANSECPPESPTAGEIEPGCQEGVDAGFATYPAVQSSPPCPNEALRVGLSAGLPDCRAYELVTPPNTSGRIPTMTMLGKNYGGNGFQTLLASPDGSSVVFGTISGALPGVGGGGYRDTFVAQREDTGGWQSRFTGADGARAEKPKPGGISSDHDYAFWFTEGDRGTLSVDGYQYLRVPGGTEPSQNCEVESEAERLFEWVGCGSLGVDPYAQGLWISSSAGHVIFETGRPSGLGSIPVQLESCGLPGARVIYDRRPGGATHCVSVPPAGSTAETEAEFETHPAEYLGASVDGSAVAFGVGQAMYVGVGEEETMEVVAGKALYGGLSTDGSRIFYLKEPSAGTIPHGELYACDLSSGPCVGAGAHVPLQIGGGGESTLVNVSADGSRVYFTSPQQLDDAKEGVPTKDNLYVWDWSSQSIDLVAVLDPSDVSGEFTGKAATTVGGLGLWTGPGHPFGSSLDPSRTSPDGETLLFESHAPLTGYENDGRSEIFRYSAEAPADERLLCLSCNPTQIPAQSGAQLQVDPSGDYDLLSLPPVNQFVAIPNVSTDGRRAFFQSADRLVNGDLDGKVDIYQWEDQGLGGCDLPAGCLSLVSARNSHEDDYLYGATPDGSDVFFVTADTLVPGDSATPSIYDARIDGGFPPPPLPPTPCQGEACQPQVAAPQDATPASVGFEGQGNPAEARPCPRGKRRAASSGHCVKRHPSKAHHRHRRGRRGR